MTLEEADRARAETEAEWERAREAVAQAEYALQDLRYEERQAWGKYEVAARMYGTMCAETHDKEEVKRWP